MARYDRAMNVFSPDDHLLQVQYALEAARKGNAAVGVCGTDTIVLGVEKKANNLQDSRTMKKIASLDSHIALASAGLEADARVLIDRARVECQSRRLTHEDPVTIEYITRYIAGLNHKYTQRDNVRPFGVSTPIVGFDPYMAGLHQKYTQRDNVRPFGVSTLIVDFDPYMAGLHQKYTERDHVRPFGVSMLIVGFDPYTGAPSLCQADPSGTSLAWKANAIGRNSDSMREFLEENYKDTSGQETVKLAIRALLEVVESGGKNIEIAVMTKEHGLRQLEESEIDAIVAEIESEKAAA